MFYPLKTLACLGSCRLSVLIQTDLFLFATSGRWSHLPPSGMLACDKCVGSVLADLKVELRADSCRLVHRKF